MFSKKNKRIATNIIKRTGESIFQTLKIKMMSVKKNQVINNERSFAQFEGFALKNTEKVTVKGGTAAQVEHGGTTVIISQ